MVDTTCFPHESPKFCVMEHCQPFLMVLSRFTLVKHYLEWGMKGLQPYGSDPGLSLATLPQFRIQVLTVFLFLKILSQCRCADFIEKALVIPDKLPNGNKATTWCIPDGGGWMGTEWEKVHVYVILFSLAVTQSKIAPAGRINRDLLQNKVQSARGASRKEDKALSDLLS